MLDLYLTFLKVHLRHCNPPNVREQPLPLPPPRTNPAQRGLLQQPLVLQPQPAGSRTPVVRSRCRSLLETLVVLEG